MEANVSEVARKNQRLLAGVNHGANPRVADRLVELPSRRRKKNAPAGEAGARQCDPKTIRLVPIGSDVGFLMALGALGRSFLALGVFRRWQSMQMPFLAMASWKASLKVVFIGAVAVLPWQSLQACVLGGGRFFRLGRMVTGIALDVAVLGVSRMHELHAAHGIALQNDTCPAGPCRAAKAKPHMTNSRARPKRTGKQFGTLHVASSRDERQNKQR